jgi:cell wall-associated NlpC family hydrolase
MRRLLPLTLTILLALPAIAVAAPARKGAVRSASRAVTRVGRDAATAADAARRASDGTEAAAAERAVKIALAERGVPYRWGGSSPSGFDCSGLVRWVDARLGIELPHSSYAQFGFGRHVSRGALQPGDLVFSNGLGHVGIYIGDGMFVHAPHTGATVRVDPVAEYGFDGARRLRLPGTV